MGRRRFGFFWSEIVDCQDSIECSLTKITAMEGDSYPPPSEMEVGNVAPEAMPVKSLVGDYSDSTSADVSHHHQDHQDQHHGGDRQDEMDHQETPSFSNGNGNGGADEEQSKDDDDAPPKEPEQKPDPFDVFGKMLSSMPAKPADEEEEKESEAKNDEKNEDADEKNEDGDEKKDTFDKMFDSEKPSDENADDEKKDTFEKMFESDKPSEESEEKKDDEEDTKPDALEKFKANEFGDRCILEEQSEDNIEYALPYGWKKIGHRRSGDQDRWDFYLITPCGKRLRSNPEIDRYLEKNPDVECDREVTNTSRPWADSTSTPAKPGKSAKSPRNYLEENISKAFKTLEVYQKALETERSRVKKTIEEGMSPDTAVSITRKLRKLYAVTQKNMDLLDRAIVESFVENFPTESTRIHMGRVAPAQPQYAAPARSRGGASKSRKNIKQKLKVRPKGKGRKAPAKGKGKGKKGTIEINGAPDYVEYDLPASAKKKRKGYRPESDVELIDVSEDDEYYTPKKRSSPGPASSKKGKPGPASKKKSSYY